MYFNQSRIYSKLYFIAAAADMGVITRKKSSNANKNKIFCSVLASIKIDFIVPTPKISTGMYNGRINNDNKIPPPRIPKVIAAPIVPIRVKVGVPMSSEINK